MAGETAPGLRREAIGLREVLLQSITAMAPATAVAASIPSGAAFAGGGLPLSVLIALVACLFTASCVAELARRSPAAGSVYTVLDFAGFGAAAPLEEETKDPRRTVHRAVLGAARAIGLVRDRHGRDRHVHRREPRLWGYFLRRGRELFEPARHLLFPLVGIVAFVPALLSAAGLPVFDFVSEPTAPVSYAGPVVGAWMIVGIVVLIFLLRRHPGRIAETARVHLDETPTPAPRQSGAVQS